MAGCAIQTPHLAISRSPVAERAGYYRDPQPYRVLMLPLADKRPLQDRRGAKPPGMFLLLWNRRVGDYYTGDQVFGGNVAGELSTQLAAYLKSANVFAQVVTPSPVPADFDHANAAQVRQVARPHAADYILTGELNRFFGSQHQHLSVYVLPLYVVGAFGWQDSKSLPWGQTVMQMVLLDGQEGDLLRNA
jgi:hypothetical protein